MASEAKRPKVRNYFYQPSWEQEYFVIPIGDVCTCLVCAHVFPSNRKSNVQGHFLQHHAFLDVDFPKGSTARTSEVEALKLRLLKPTSVNATTIVASDSNSTTRLSFKIAYILAKAMKPFDDGAIIKEAMTEMANELMKDRDVRDSILSKVQNTPLSRVTMSRRVKAISTNIQDQLTEDLRECEWFSLQLDESTDVTDVAQVSVFIRMVFDDYTTTEELLSVIPLKGRTTGKDIFSALKDILTQRNVPLGKLVAITTDDTPAMIGRHAGLIPLCKQDPDFPAALLNFHCIIHQQALCIKSVNMDHVMQPVIKIVNYIRARPLQHRLFQALLRETEDKHNDLTLHCEVGWLSRGKVLERFYEVLPEIKTFLESSNEDVEQLHDQSWLTDLAFCVDLMKQINTLNLTIRGKNIPIWTSISAVENFREHVTTWADFFRKNVISAKFENLKKSVQESSTESEFRGERFACWLEKLAEGFLQRFQEFDAIKKLRNYFYDPMVQQDTTNVAGIIRELFPTIDMCGIREEMVSIRHNETYRFRFSKCSDVDECWKTVVDKTQYSNLLGLYKRLLSCFASSYLCESMFSSMKHVKSRLRSRLTDENREHLLRISTSSYAPNFQALAEDTQAQASH